eukprot:s1433_g5.t1
MIRRDQLIWPARRSVRVDHGDNIIIEIQQPLNVAETSISEQVDVSDDLTLLQRFAQKTTSHCEDAQPSRERLTADAVAHAQRPRGDDAHTIHIADLLPVPVWTYVDCQRVDFLRRQLLDTCSWQASVDIDASWCPSTSWSHLLCTPCWTFEHPEAFVFYSDGSYHRATGHAAAGVVLLVRTSDGWRFGGFQAAPCLGEASSPRAEATGLLLALQWALALVHSFDYCATCFSFHFDSVYAGNVAQGRSSSDHNQDLTMFVRSCTLWLEQHLCVPLEWTHVSGHSDHPWNDLADAVASRARKEAIVTHDVAQFFAHGTFDGTDTVSAQWLWLYERSLQGRSDAPLLHQFHWRFNTAAPLRSFPDVSCQPFAKRQVKRNSCDVRAKQFTLRCGTANVLTLYPAQDFASSFFGARAEHLAAQFCAAGLHCVALQETRSRRHGYASFDRFHTFSGSATARGHGGVQLWILRKLPMPQGSVDLLPEHFRILHGDDRRLIVRLSHPILKLLFVVLHAPCDEDADSIAAWWKLTTQCIPSSFSTWTWILLCDANSRLGTETSSAIGSHGAEQENSKGAYFHEWLQRHNLWLPQTFEVSHSGSHATWTHASHGTSRLDYVGVSTNVAIDQVHTWVSDSIDLSVHRPDHECVCADIVLLLL